MDQWKIGLPGDSAEIRALLRLAIMYHAQGNYEKSEELLKLAQRWRRQLFHKPERMQGNDGRKDRPAA